MFFTQEDYLKIEDWLRRRAIKDTWFDPADTLKGDEQVAIIQDNRNKRMPIQQLIRNLGEVIIEGGSYFLNLNACLNTPDTQYTFSEAIEAIPERYRIKGLTLNYLGNGYMGSPKWYMLRFEGNLEDFEDISKWKSMTPSHISQTDALTIRTEPDGNVYFNINSNKLLKSVNDRLNDLEGDINGLRNLINSIPSAHSYIEGLGIRLEQGVIPTETSINTDALLLDEYPEDMYIITDTNNPYLILESDLNNSPDYRNFFKVVKIKGYTNYDEETPNSLEEDGQREKWICIPPATASRYGLYNPTHYSIVQSLTNGFVTKISSKYSRYFNISAKAGTNNREFELDNTWIENLTKNYILKEYTQNGISEDSLDTISKIQGISIQDPSTNTRYVVASMKALETMPLYKLYDELDKDGNLPPRSIIKAINDIEGDVDDIQYSIQIINNTINNIEVPDISGINSSINSLEHLVKSKMSELSIVTSPDYKANKIFAYNKFLIQSSKNSCTIPDIMFSILMQDQYNNQMELFLGIKSFSFMPCMYDSTKCIIDGISLQYHYKYPQGSIVRVLSESSLRYALSIVPEYTYYPSTNSGVFSLNLVIEADLLREDGTNTIIDNYKPIKIRHNCPGSFFGPITLGTFTHNDRPIENAYTDSGNVISCLY